MTDTYTITHLEYDERDDVLLARAFQSDAFNLDAPVTSESDARVIVEMTISSQGASIRDTAGHGECDFAYLATVLDAFATAWQSAHEDRQSLSLTWQGRSIAPFPMRKWKSPPTALPLLARQCMLA